MNLIVVVFTPHFRRDILFLSDIDCVTETVVNNFYGFYSFVLVLNFLDDYRLLEILLIKRRWKTDKLERLRLCCRVRG